MKKLFIITALSIAFTLCLQSQNWRILSGTIVTPKAAVYTANDVVGDTLTGWKILAINNASEGVGHGGKILEAVLTCDTINVTNGTYRLFLFADTAGFTNAGMFLADHAAYTLLAVAQTSFVGYIDFTLVTGAAGSTLGIAQNTAPGIVYITDSSKKLFAQLVATGAHAKTYQATYRIRLKVELN